MSLATAPGPTGGGGSVRPTHAPILPIRPPIEAGHWYDVDALAAHYALPKSTVRELILGGVIPATKVGRGWRAHGQDILDRDAELRRAAAGPSRAERAAPDDPATPDPSGPSQPR